MWFRGVHSDVGGGNENIGLNNIALRWMLKKAIALGLPVEASVLSALEAQIDVDAPIDKKLDLIKNKPRKISDTDRIHYTVAYRSGEQHQNPPGDCPRETPEDEDNL